MQMLLHKNFVCRLKTLLADTNFTDAKIASNDSKRGRILELEAKCFQLQKDFDDEHSNMLVFLFFIL